MKKKPVALLLSGVLLLGFTVGGTLAWLTAESETVNNTFTVGNIEIWLNETTGEEYLMTPGVTLPKDPTVTVKAGSEDCYVFIKVEESGGNITVNSTDYSFDDFIEYDVDPNNWKQLDDNSDVYWCEVTDLTADRNIKVLLNEQIAVKNTITKTMMQNLEKAGNESYPTLTFTAYAVQMYKSNTGDESVDKFSAEDAWKQVKDLPVDTASDAGTNTNA